MTDSDSATRTCFSLVKNTYAPIIVVFLDLNCQFKYNVYVMSCFTLVSLLQGK